jgi:HEPN domain-containing protein
VTTQNEDILGRDMDYLKYGIEYYIAGRFGFLNKFLSSGVLFHQAFEWIMKGGLIKNDRNYWDEKRLRDLDHNLVKIWNAYTNNVKCDIPQDLREQIELLDRWYLIRYPVFKEGKPNTLLITKQYKAAHLSVDGQQNYYILSLDMIDKIFYFLSESWTFNPLSVLPFVKDDGYDLFFEENPYWSRK